jgi:hypothetical protein
MFLLSDHEHLFVVDSDVLGLRIQYLDIIRVVVEFVAVDVVDHFFVGERSAEFLLGDNSMGVPALSLRVGFPLTEEFDLFSTHCASDSSA